MSNFINNKKSHIDWMNTDQKKNPYLDTFHTVINNILFSATTTNQMFQIGYRQ